MEDDFDYAAACAGAAAGSTFYSFPTAPNIARDDIVMLVVFPAYGEDDPGMHEVLVDHGSIDGRKWMTVALIGRVENEPSMLQFEDNGILHAYRFHEARHPLFPMAGGTLGQVASHALGLRQPGEEPASASGVRTAIEGQSALSMKGHQKEALPGVRMFSRYLEALKACIAVTGILLGLVLTGVSRNPILVVTGFAMAGAMVGLYPVIAEKYRAEIRDLPRLPADFAQNREETLRHTRHTCALLMLSTFLLASIAFLLP